ncbi:MAG: biopolymer transporter ExbD [Sandaracinaceae bacterium]|nr:biopolymer transporter ExbD [Sandaracinaceae bacterium]
MSTGGGGRRAPLSEINVTPMVDVMLVLLIIFMVSAPLLSTGVTVDLPSARAPAMQMHDEKLLLTVTEDQKVYLGENEVPYDRLEDVLLHNARLQSEKELYVQADENVPYGFVVKVLAIVRRAGIEKLGLVTDPVAADTTATAQAN